MPDQLPVEGPWVVAEGKHDDRTMFITRNDGYRRFKSVSGYEHQVGIAVPLNDPEVTGLPGAAELALLDGIEDAICSSLEEQAESLFVAVITTGGMRELVFYTRYPDRVRERVAKLRESITSHEIQLTIQPDSDWQIYARLS